MRKIIVYGTGEYYRNNKNKLPSDTQIVAYGDSNCNNATSITGKLFNGKEILTPEEFIRAEYDYIYICTSYTAGNRIFQNLKKHNIDIKKIRFLNRIDVLDEDGGWVYEAADDESIISMIGNVRIREKYLTDFDIVAEVFVNNTYNVNLPQKDTVLIDVGMNIGAVSLYFAGKSWVSKVYGYEPFPDTFKQALENFELNDSNIKSKIYPINRALLDKDGDIEVPIATGDTGWRTVLAEDDGGWKMNISCKDAAAEIGRVIDENVGKRIILKIDTEGSEFAIFNSLKKTNLLNAISAIMMEYHRNPKEILELLTAYQFKYFVTGHGIGMIYAVK